MIPIQLAKAAALWLLLCGMISGLVWVMGCATVGDGPLCSAGHPALPRIETRFVGVELTIKCGGDGAQQEEATLKIRSSEWIWTALSAAVASIATALIADDEPSVGSPVKLAGTPDATTEYRPTLDALAPLASSRTEALRPVGWPTPLASLCGGPLQEWWCQ